MKLGIMQPYFLPYLGYWQLLASVDSYVVYDDVNYIKGGWINRNRILINGEAHYINLPVVGASPNKLINEIEANVNPRLQDKTLRMIDNAYRRAPYYDEVLPLIESVVRCKENNLASNLYHSLQEVCCYLEIETKLLLSSDLNKDSALKSQEKVLAICEELGADEYFNSIGGRGLYSSAAFAAKGISLHFLSTHEIVYKQFSDEFIPNLSIVDVLMFNGRSGTIRLLEEYSLM